MQLDIALQCQGSINKEVVSSHVVIALLRCTKEWFQTYTLYIEKDIKHTCKKRICKDFKTFFGSFQDALSAIHILACILVFT